ncbi:hypothetical protein Ancab_001626 [Ancistrocladus abbreviatus]
MSVSCCSSSLSLGSISFPSYSYRRKKHHLDCSISYAFGHPNTYSTPLCSSTTAAATVTCRLGVRLEDVASIAQNKVLVAAALSAAIGQLSKPFTSVILYGKTFNLKALIQAGGFPSTHSSMVVAAATSLGLERGFSDSIFGLTVVYATLIMYDAQGVRREVGNHAKTINKMLLHRQVKSVGIRKEDEYSGSPPALKLESLGSLLSKEAIGPGEDGMEERMVASLSHESDLRKGAANQDQDLVECSLAADIETANSCSFLNESVGHTELEVIAGACLGFLLSMTVYSLG